MRIIDLDELRRRLEVKVNLINRLIDAKLELAGTAEVDAAKRAEVAAKVAALEKEVAAAG